MLVFVRRCFIKNRAVKRNEGNGTRRIDIFYGKVPGSNLKSLPHFRDKILIRWRDKKGINRGSKHTMKRAQKEINSLPSRYQKASTRETRSLLSEETSSVRFCLDASLLKRHPKTSDTGHTVEKISRKNFIRQNEIWDAPRQSGVF